MLVPLIRPIDYFDTHSSKYIRVHFMQDMKEKKSVDMREMVIPGLREVRSTLDYVTS